MIKRFGAIEVPVSDMERAVSFYENILKLRKIYEHPVWTSFDIGGTQFAIAASGTKGQSKEADLCTSCSPCVLRKMRSVGEDPSVTALLYLAVDNLDSTYEKLKEHGVEFVTEPRVQGWGGKTAVMLDPDKNVLILTEYQ